MLPIDLVLSLILAGVGSGLASGLFGIGGGIVAVPAVLFLAGADIQSAVAASLLSMTLTTPLGLGTHHRAGHVRWRLGFLLALGGAAGIAAALAVEPHLRARHLELAFTLLLLFTAHRLLYEPGPLLRLKGGAGALATGIGAGFVAKLLGIGGGILIVPALAFAGFTMHAAVATSLIPVFTNGFLSTSWNLVAQGPHAPWVAWGLALSGGALLGIFLGSRLGVASQDQPLRHAFGLLLLYVAVALALRAVA